MRTPSLKKAAAARELEQFEQAERVLSQMRWLGMASWAWLLSRGEFTVAPIWPYAIFAGSIVYTALVYVAIRRTERLRVLAAATTLADSTIVTLMCLVTGGIHSDFVPYYYITTLAGSVRFGPRETAFALVLNSLCSTFVYFAAPGPTYPPGDLLLEIYYMLFIAVMSGWLSRLAKEHYRRALVLLDDVTEARDRGQELLRRLIHAEEEERKRVAGEIHDRMGARFFELFFSLRRCQEELGGRDPAAADVLSRLSGEAQAFSDEIRSVMNELRPTVLDDFGFTEALREYVASLQGQGGPEVSLRIDGALPVLRSDVGVMLFRIVQEAVLNVRKHASARHLSLELGAANGREIRLAIRDDGVGFDPDALPRGHYGLLHMKERAEACGGRLTILSRPREGTEVRVSVDRQTPEHA